MNRLRYFCTTSFSTLFETIFRKRMKTVTRNFFPDRATFEGSAAAHSCRANVLGVSKARQIFSAMFVTRRGFPRSYPFSSSVCVRCIPCFVWRLSSCYRPSRSRRRGVVRGRVVINVVKMTMSARMKSPFCRNVRFWG